MCLNAFLGCSAVTKINTWCRKEASAPALGQAAAFLQTEYTSYESLSTCDLINFVAIRSINVLHILLVNTSQNFSFVTVDNSRFLLQQCIC